MRVTTVWVPTEPGTAAVVRDAATGVRVPASGPVGRLELPDGAGGWYSVAAVRGAYAGADGRYAVVRFACGATVRAAIVWATQFARDGRRPR